MLTDSSFHARNISGGFVCALLAACCLAVFASYFHAEAAAQVLPPAALPPLLYVRITGPKGMQATFYRGAKDGQTFTAPFVIGLRPGYSYRMAVTGLPNYREVTLYPTLQVHGSLLLGNKLRAADFPATLSLTDEDFSRVREGALITKVIVLERPDAAIPFASAAEQPLEVEAPLGRSPWLEARERGQPLLVMYMGQRQMSPPDLVAHPGTLLLPGEKVLPPPRYPPTLPWACHPVVDPILGPAPPWESVTLFDGGDVGRQAGLDREGRLRGLDPTDTVAEYADSRGRRHVAVSNRIGLCVPRFIVTRGETVLENQVARLGPAGTTASKGQAFLRFNQPVVDHYQNQHLDATLGRSRASGSIQTIGTTVVGRADGVQIVATLRDTAEVVGSGLPPASREPADRPLLVIKWPDRCGAQVGDVITIHIRFTNQGGQPIRDIVVSDSLTPRLEYLPGTAKADRDTVFTTQANDAGSQILRWEIAGTLLPRESGLISFQVRVR